MSEAVPRQTIFSGRIIDVGLEEHLLPNGRQATFEVIRHPGGAAVLPVLPDGRLLMIHQYRPVIGRMIYEIPAGRLEVGESPEECVARELVEETGYHAEEFTALGSLWSAVGFCDERVDLFIATGLTETQSALEPDEVIELAPMTLEEALALVDQGDLLDSKTLVALLRYARMEGVAR
ncbi:MAG: NUDIX hydrolase [Desulfuromonadales bacterium]|jgi:ADP-ribose pyrophosphatase|nr:NUDIX hydrolase [Desulfuromonadales bacterium]